jgi:hypothetical protein
MPAPSHAQRFTKMSNKWAIPKDVGLVIGETGDDPLVTGLIAERKVSAIIHFAASIVVPNSMSDPLRYYRNNTVNSIALIECAVRSGVRHLIFSSTAAVYGNPVKVPISEDDAAAPTSPYGSSKLMTEIMLRDAGSAHGLDYVILRYFNVAGVDHLCARGNRPEARPISSRWQSRRRWANGRRWMCSGPITRRQTGLASATTFTSPTWCAPMLTCSAICGRADDRRRSTAAMATDFCA